MFSLNRYKKLILPILIIIVLVFFAAQLCKFSWTDLARGFPKGLILIKLMVPPDWSAFPEMVGPALETVVIAIFATVIGSILSLLFGLAAAKNISHPVLRNTTRFLIALERSLPEIFIILLLVAALGLGPVCGVIALAIGCIGMLGKLIADAIEEIDAKILESIETTGANKFQLIKYGVIPQVTPALISNTIFRFEVNIRLSVLLGAVGAGGIGFELSQSFNMLEYQRATTAIIVTLILVFLTERLSDFLRNKILESGDNKMKTSTMKAWVPVQRFRKRSVTIITIFLIVTLSAIFLGFNPVLFISDFHYMVSLFREMIPDNLEILTRPIIFLSIAQTVSMAFLGTLFGGTIALCLAFFAADNTSPSPFLRTVIRTLLAFERVTPSMVIILVFIIALGIGPFAGMLALTVGTLGMFGKLFADAIENVEFGPLEAIYSTGAHKLQTIRYGILPQVLPSFIANFFYAFDVNMRAAIFLGIFGGGGIGYQYYMVMKVLRYKDALALICFTIVLITLLEKISDYLRKRVIGVERLK